MKITNNLHAFVWESMTTNNCNSYLIGGSARVLIDPGHSRLFDHVELGLKELGLTTSDIGLVICTHAHPDHIEGVQLLGTALPFSHCTKRNGTGLRPSEGR